MQTTVLFTFLIGVIDAFKGIQEHSGTSHLVIPSAILTLGISKVFFKAAEVTDKCTRVPSLINSCDFGCDIDADRTYVVEYVLNSSAGFHIFEIRLTSGETMKFANICVV